MVTLNLHINYTCPLKCRYCVQREDKELLSKYLTAKEMIEKVQAFMDYTQVKQCRVNISGGEPLLKFKDIQILMEHFPNNIYEISTSGYLLDAEKAKYFSNFGVYYVLSVDGGERVTNYLRPLANGKKGYFEQLKKNIPHILFYAPETRAKLIVPKNLISEVYNSYLELEQLGFLEIFITPNVYENEVDNAHPELQTGIWDQNDWAAYNKQIQLITNEIIEGIKINKKRCMISNILYPMYKLTFPEKHNNFNINYNKMICTVLDLKGGAAPKDGANGKELGKISLCMDNISPFITTQKELLQRVQNDYSQLNKDICPKDNDCPYFSSCLYSTCLCENLKENYNKNIWIPSNFQCKMQKIYHDKSIQCLKILNTINNQATDYYWTKIIKIKEGVENGID